MAPKTFHFARERKKVYDLAYNLRWSYDCPTQEFFARLSARAWDRSNHNPIAVLSEISEEELRTRLRDTSLHDDLDRCYGSLQDYLKSVNKQIPAYRHLEKHPVAYFSAEIGIHESLPIYSGGLGILSGDHTKSASDIGLNFVGVTLFYRQGYFVQRVNSEGAQLEEYSQQDYRCLPIVPVTDEGGNLVKVQVQIGRSTVSVAAYKAVVGRSVLYFLETNLPENEEHYRDLTARVYGGDSTTRISQEIILGVGGAKFLKELEYDPAVYHMNEGHSAFLTLELLHEQLLAGKSTSRAVEEVKKKCVFTTHTPVAAGHDRFTQDLINFSLSGFVTSLGISLDEFMKFGRVNPDDKNETFCMTVLALKMSRAANAVSELNGQVSRQMWTPLYPGRKTEQVPIGHVTNGIHSLTWLHGEARKFYENHVGMNWINKLESYSQWQSAVNKIQDEELWALRYLLRRRLIEFVRERLKRQQIRFGNSSGWVEKVLCPDALTIGFSRRFATYKRAPLLFTDIERAAQLLGDNKRQVQIIFSGKAHPRDDAGKSFIQQIIHLSRDPHFAGKIVFAEDYDMGVAGQLVAGCDVWLNNPRRPLEASGTSGEKVILNGGLNCSIMDGWWREAYNGKNGFAIGEDKDSNVSIEEQDRIDSQNLYDVIENKVVPIFYDRDGSGIPLKWIKMIKESVKTIAPVYNTNRMVKEYADKYYLQR
ncbi:MAG TPA: alpha-glucan family phosphorylase [Candidatus Acidoferrales bacterium]|nr:alpha-glucan family phosphorylase [Candidatus Acidoferrales bacterium]